MTDNLKTRLFVPLPMNPLHRHPDKDPSQIERFETDLKRSTSSVSHGTGLSPTSSHVPSLFSRIHPSQPNSTSDTTIIEIIKPDKQKQDSTKFIPAFAKPSSMTHGSSLKPITLMNLEPLKASFLQAETTRLSPLFSSGSYIGQHGLQASVQSPFSSPKFLQSAPAFEQLVPQPSTIFSLPSGKSTFGLNQHDISNQQLQVQATDDSSSNSETQSSHYASSDNGYPIPQPPDSPISIKKFRGPRTSTQYQWDSLTRVKVVSWVTELKRYQFLLDTGRASSAHAAELHNLLCTIEDKMTHPFLTPQILAETRLGRVMNEFRHGEYDARSKKVAHHITKYWRKVCLEA